MQKKRLAWRFTREAGEAFAVEHLKRLDFFVSFFIQEKKKSRLERQR